jgi:hypothetical protein
VLRDGLDLGNHMNHGKLLGWEHSSLPTPRQLVMAPMLPTRRYQAKAPIAGSMIFGDR